MAAQVNLQRNSKVFWSTVDLNGGAAITSVTPANTWRVEVLAGMAFSQAAANQDITTFESGTSPDRSTQRFNTAIEPAEWNFQAYLRPTGINATVDGAGGTTSSNSLPVADWFLWQSMLSGTAFASGTDLRSAWQADGKFTSIERVTSANVAAHNPNFASAVENHLYIQTDNVIYQLANATVNQATVDAAIDGIASTTWTGFSTNLVELTGGPRDAAVSIFGGVLNSGTTVATNANSSALSVTAHYHPWNSYNVNGTLSTADFIKNRLSTIVITDGSSGSAVNYTFPVTALSIDFNNNITYLTPEELAALNQPIGQFAGARTITGSMSAYLRGGSDNSAALLRNISSNTLTSTSQGATANLKIGGATVPYVAFNFPAVQFSFPTTSLDDVLGMDIEFLAQETTANKGKGDEVEIHAAK